MPPCLATTTQSFWAGCFPFAGERGDVITLQEHKVPFRPKIKRFNPFIQASRSGPASGLSGLAQQAAQGFHSMTLMAIWAARRTASLGSSSRVRKMGT